MVITFNDSINTITNNVYPNNLQINLMMLT